MGENCYVYHVDIKRKLDQRVITLFSGNLHTHIGAASSASVTQTTIQIKIKFVKPLQNER